MDILPPGITGTAETWGVNIYTYSLNIFVYHYLIFYFRHGCTHEKDGRAAYEAAQMERHEGLSVSDAGFCINPQYPHIGASPDAWVTCGCCGQGIVEVKCPFCLKDKAMHELDGKFCLQADASGNLSLKEDHPYYYQVQAQLHVTQTAYCDFVVWADNKFDTTHIQRIVPDNAFLDSVLPKIDIFYLNGILPEILGKWFTVPRTPASAQTSSGQSCYCGEPADDNMLECKSGRCTVLLFHKKCLAFSLDRRVPKKWKCPSCTKILNKEKRDQKKASILAQPSS